MDKNDILFCDATFRCRDNFGKELASWPVDLQIAVRRALHNFREQNPDAGALIHADIDWSHSTSVMAISHPWVVQISVFYSKQKPN